MEQTFWSLLHVPCTFGATFVFQPIRVRLMLTECLMLFRHAYSAVTTQQTEMESGVLL
jgi:hypothetical protein